MPVITSYLEKWNILKKTVIQNRVPTKRQNDADVDVAPFHALFKRGNRISGEANIFDSTLRHLSRKFRQCLSENDVQRRGKLDVVNLNHVDVIDS